MPNYIRLYQSGGIYFFTVVTYQRRPILHNGNISLFIECYEETRTKYPFKNKALVILPDHIHSIWTLPEGDSDFSSRWNMIKRTFSRKYKGKDDIRIPESHKKGREQVVWQRRFWEDLIRNQEEFNNLCDYIHYNPVKHKLVKSPGEWKNSSFFTYVEQGFYPEDWMPSTDIIPMGIDLE